MALEDEGKNYPTTLSTRHMLHKLQETTKRVELGQNSSLFRSMNTDTNIKHIYSPRCQDDDGSHGI